MQGTRILRNEVYLQYVGMTKDESQRSPSTLLRAVSLSNGRWAFCEVVKGEFLDSEQHNQFGFLADYYRILIYSNAAIFLRLKVTTDNPT